MLPQPTTSRSLETVPFLTERHRPLKAEWQAEVRKASCTRRANGNRPVGYDDEDEGDGAMACHAGSVAVLLKTSGRTVWNWCQKPNPIWWRPGSSRTAFVIWDCSYLFVSYICLIYKVLLRLYLSKPLRQFKVNVITSSTRWPKMIWLIFGSAELNSCFDSKQAQLKFDL